MKSSILITRFFMVKILFLFAFSAPLLAKSETSKKGSAKKSGITKIDIELSSKGSDIAFDTTSFQVPHGTDISIKFSNKAHKDQEISHNIAFLKQGTLDEVLKAFSDSDYDVEKIKKHKSIIAMTSLLNPGQEENLILPKEKIAKPGYYPYVCLVPGHGDILGMKGLMYVKKK